MTDTPITKDTTDHDVWGAALHKALHEPASSDKVDNPEAFSSWFATAIEAGRRAERLHPPISDADLVARLRADRLGGPLHKAGQ